MTPVKPLTVAISSRALFDLAASDHVYESQGLEAYRQFQIDHEDAVLEPGQGFIFVEKLLNINKLLGKHRVEIILLSRNSADTGLRIFNSIKAHQLDITRAAFCGGESPYRYIQGFGCDLFLSTEADDVGHALQHGVAAATLLGRMSRPAQDESNELRLAFDGDAVLFSDEAERIYQERGLDAFSATEAAAAAEPLGLPALLSTCTGFPNAHLYTNHSTKPQYPARYARTVRNGLAPHPGLLCLDTPPQPSGGLSRFRRTSQKFSRRWQQRPHSGRPRSGPCKETSGRQSLPGLMQ